MFSFYFFRVMDHKSFLFKIHYNYIPKTQTKFLREANSQRRVSIIVALSLREFESRTWHFYRLHSLKLDKARRWFLNC